MGEQVKKPCGFGAFWRDRRGVSAVMVALTMPVLVASLGLATDTGYWYFTQRKVQNAADAAAYAGAVELRAERSLSAITQSATHAANEAGFKQPIGTITVNAPPVSGAYTTAEAVEITIVENTPKFFSSIFSSGTIPIAGRAVAMFTPGRPACLLSLDPGASGAVTFTGAADLTLDGCDVTANSIHSNAVTVDGGGVVATPCVSAAGGVSATAGLTVTDCAQPIENAPVVNDPYAGVTEPMVVGACQTPNVFDGAPGTVWSVPAGRYCGGMTMKRIVNLDPGVYIIDGGSLTVESTAAVSGSGVTFFLTNGATLKIAGTASLDLSAPTSGTYSGLLIFGDRDDPYADHYINGDSDSTLTGAVYIPTGNIILEGSGTTSPTCTQIVGYRVRVAGAAALGSDCTGRGTADLRSGQLVMLVE